MYDKSKQYFSNISRVGAESAPTFPNLGRKAPPNIINNNIVNDIGNTFVNFESRFHP